MGDLSCRLAIFTILTGSLWIDEACATEQAGRTLDWVLGALVLAVEAFRTHFTRSRAKSVAVVALSTWHILTYLPSPSEVTFEGQTVIGVELRLSYAHYLPYELMRSWIVCASLTHPAALALSTLPIILPIWPAPLRARTWSALCLAWLFVEPSLANLISALATVLADEVVRTGRDGCSALDRTMIESETELTGALSSLVLIFSDRTLECEFRPDRTVVTCWTAGSAC